MEITTKSGLYVPKRGRGLAGKQTAKTTVKPTSSAENAQTIVSVTSSLRMETQTQIANQLFQERIKKIADAKVTIRAGENEWEPIYRIEVPELRSEAFNKVVKLRSDLYRKYPDAIINIFFRPLRELSECPIPGDTAS